MVRRERQTHFKVKLNEPASLYEKLRSLTFLKRTLDLPKLEGIAVADGGGNASIDAFAVDAGEIGAIEIGELVGATDMLDGGVTS